MTLRRNRNSFVGINTSMERLVLVKLAGILVTVLSMVQYTYGAMPTFTSPATATFTEDKSIGYVVLTLAATDIDSGTITFGITSQNPATPVKFGVNGANLVTTNTFDYEAAADRQYTVTVTATTDSTNDVATSTITVDITDVNDNSPAFTSDFFYASVTENAPQDTFLIKTSATDADGDALTYSITSGDDGAAKFQYDATNTDNLETTPTAINYESLGGQNFKYTLTVQVSDGTNTDTATVIVTVTGENEDSPVWGTSSPTGTISIAEDVNLGTVIVTVTATDADEGIDGQIVYSLGTITASGSGSTSGLFHINQVTGALSTTGTFDRDPTATNTAGISSYSVTVIASDLGTPPRVIQQSLTVAITDVNDNAPVFSSSVYYHTFPEDTNAGTSLMTITATDNDVMSALTYSLQTVTAKFSYDSITGQLDLSAVVDLDTVGEVPSHILVLTASDGGNTATTTVVLTVTPMNEFIPVLNDVVVTIAESTAIGSVVTTLVATDGDSDAVFTYTITGGNTAGKFAIHSSTGAVEVAEGLDFEDTSTYSLTVQVSDANTSPNTDTAVVSVTLTDVSDEPPTCTSSLLTHSISENTAAPYNVPVTITCSDSDAVDTKRYSLTAGNSEGKFSIASASGVLTLGSALDYDQGTRHYSLTVEYTDGTATVEVTVIINVQATNELTPTFGADQTVSWDENTAVGTVLATHAASDDDAAPHGIVTYEITAVTNSGAPVFSIAQDGGITLARALDYESQTSYVITVVATDGGNLQGTGTVTIQVVDVNDVAPSCTQTIYTPTVAENTASTSTVIADLGCTDADSAVLTYTITSQTPSDHFEVTTTGTPQLKTKAFLDYETTRAYAIEITVSDGSLTSIIYVDITISDINDGPPSFVNAPYTKNIADNTAVGTSVLDVTTSDPDTTNPLGPSGYGTLKYSITNGHTDNKFIINPDSGRINTAGVLSVGTYTLTVEVAELNGGNTDTTTATVNVTYAANNPPTCSPLTFSVTKAEEGTANDVLRSFTCTDLDGHTLTYAVTNGDTTYFQMTGATLNLKAPIDFDTVVDPEFDLEVTVSDGLASVLISGTVIVTGLNEHTPTFTGGPYSVSQVESFSPGQLLQTVAAADADKGDSVTFSWVTATTDFTLDQVSGEIRLATTLDRETTSSYTLTLRASDGSNSVTTTFTLTVTDINDNSPVFNPDSYSVSLSESTGAGSAVVTVTASDADDPATNNYGTLRYAIADGNTGTAFSIDTTTGAIQTAIQLDYETATTYTLYVRAYDSLGAAGSRSSTAVVTVTITPVNEFDPAFQNTPYAASFAEDTAIGTSLVTVQANDQDNGDDGDVYYTMGSSTLFYLDSQSGQISLKGLLNYENATSHTLTVTARDSGTTSRSATVQVTITVTDTNDNTPACTNSFQTVTFAEDHTGTVAGLTCSDNDGTAANNVLSYSVVTVNGAASTIFTMNAANLQATGFDYETDTSYNVIIRVQDSGAQSLSSTATVRVEITDVNEHTPVFSQAGGYSLTMSEATAAGTSVAQVAATDGDNGQTVSFQINPASNEFNIESGTGKIFLVNSLDYDLLAQKTFHLTVEAVDDGGNPGFLTGTTSLNITITDVNDVTPTFNPVFYTASVTEGVTAATVVVVTATDIDDVTPVTLNLVNTFSLFTIGTGGTISLLAGLSADYESVKSYTLVVHAVDAQANTGSATVFVTVTNVNDMAPVYATAAGTVTINENVASGTTIIDVDATDVDDGPDGELTYSITSQPANLTNVMALDPSTGVMTVAGAIDRERITTSPVYFTIQVTDAGIPAKTADFSLTLHVTDVNEHTPVCSPSTHAISLLESATGLSTVATLACTDSDATSPNNDISYAFVTGNDGGGNFAVDASGVVTLVAGASLDRETVASYLVLVEVSDGGTTSLTTTATLTISVTDENDNNPVFAQTDYSFDVDEGQPVGFSIGSVAATDADIDLAGSVVYSIFSGNVDSNLAIDANTGEIKVVGTVDFESATTYTLTVHATDKDTTPRTGTTSVTINVQNLDDEPPACNPVLQTVTFAEDTVTNTAITTLACTDVDSGTITYVIASVDGVATTTPFTLNPASSNVLALSSSLDYENDQLKTVVIHAIANSQTATATVKVVVTDVNEHDPVFTGGGTFTASISETASVGDAVTIIGATDADTDNTITYAINPESQVFEINPTSGQVILSALLDFDTVNSYTLTVSAIDSGTTPRQVTTSLVITVTDSNDRSPVFNPAVYTASISENDPVGTLVTTVTATDVDSPTIAYTIISGNTDTVFRAETSGNIVIDNVSNLDYDSVTKSYRLVVQASDGTNVGTATVAIAVTNYNDKSPTFGGTTSSTQTLAENSAVGTAIVTVVATDADDGPDGVITYSITAGNAAGKFAVNPTSGEVTLAGTLDIETQEIYTVTLTATDGGTNPGALSSTYVLTVQVTDINDVTPVCTKSLYSATIDENSGPSTSVAQITCTDGDKTTANNVINSYNLQPAGNTGGDFSVSASGEVQVVNSLDRERTATYSLVIEVIDSGTTARTTTTTVAVNVNDLNDNPPVFPTGPYHATVSESESVGFSVTSIIATDADIGDAGTVTYSINSGNVNNKLAIDAASGDINIASSLDFDSGTQLFVLEIFAIDNDPSAPQTGSTTLSLTVTDANDNSPSCTPNLISVASSEALAGSSNVTALTCTDADSGANAALTYTILSINGNALTTFEINAAGVVTTAAATLLDYETVSSYSVLVTVKDGGTPQLTTTVTVNVDITDFNEHTPAFQSTPYTQNVPENSAVGTAFLTVTATDDDGTSTVTYSINPSNQYFEIDAQSGQISTIALIDFDTLATNPIALTVVASDGTNQATETVTLTVLDANDGIPVFNPGVYAVSIAESTMASTTITTVTVTDIDDSTFTFSIQSGNTGNCFTVDNTGNVILSDVSNFEYDSATKSYLLVVRAVDSGNNVATATVAIEVTSVNEATPVLTQSTKTVSLAEDSALGTSVDTVAATDSDHGPDGTLTYTINSATNNGTSKFTISPTSGLVSLAGSLDAETVLTYELEILVADGGTNPGALTATYSLTVSVMDVNDVAPSCTQTAYVATIAEDAALLDTVTTFTCTDGDVDPANNVVTYNITSGNTGGAFRMTGAAVHVNFASNLDRETIQSYSLLVDVIDSGTPSLTSKLTLTVIITDVNDNDPVFTNTPYIVTYDESLALGSTIETVQATDSDIGDNAKLVFSILSGDVDSKFGIDPDTGDIVLVASLDYETATANPYSLTVHVTDSSPSSPRTATAVVQVNIQDANDNSPVCTPMLVTYSLSEATATSTNTLFSLNCTDADTVALTTLAYTIPSVTSTPAGIINPFTIDTSGAVRLQTLVDYEQYQAMTLLVEVSDGGATPNTVTVTVEVDITNFNDGTPSFQSTPYSTNVREDTTVGSTIFTVTATDLDVADTITFSIQTPMNEFDIDPSSGDIILKQLLDFETNPNTYEIVVVATDSGTVPGPNSFSATVTITVTNFNDGTPEFSPGVYAVELSEDAANMHTVVMLTVTDTDSTTFTYAITSGNSGNVFAISGTTTTAYVTVSDRTNLDMETVSSYVLIVTSSDSGGRVGTATVNIAVTGVNEFTPTFVPSSSTVPMNENSAIGTQVIVVAATDNDIGSDGDITYSITSISNGGSGKFAVNPTTGEVTVAGSLDREAFIQYVVVIDATDGGTNPSAMSSQYTLTVTLTDVNDHTPYCSSSLYSASIAENSTTGTSVAQLTCTDADATAPNNVVNTYSITVPVGAPFLISTTGEVTTASATLDRETLDNYELTIEVVDSGTTPGQFTTTTTLTITVTDVNDNAPVFNASTYHLTVAEDSSLYASIGAVGANDLDIGQAGTVGFTIVGGNSENKFSIDRSTGILKVTSLLDFETTASYNLTIHAIDKEATFRSGTATVSITVTDVNDNMPICTASLYTGSIPENSAAGTAVVTVVCTDIDSTVLYSITSGHTEFIIDPNTGAVTVSGAGTLDIESTGSYDITVQASDGTHTADVIVKVTLINVNDETPVFSPTGPYTQTIAENLAIGSTVYDINATDADVSGTSFLYSIVSGNTNNVFTIGTSSGIIQTQKAIDRDNPLTTSYTLGVQVADGTGAGASFSATNITVSITDQNDNYPTCDQSTYTVTVSEAAVVGFSLLTPVCSDLDMAASPTLDYSITAGNGDDKFQINTGTGEISLKNSLDYESNTEYTLTISVDDQGTGTNLVTTLTVHVYVDPVNEHTPVFQGRPYTSSISESAAHGTIVVTISATDADTGANHGDVTYVITAGNNDGLFSIDPSTGQITTSGSLDRETTASFALTVRAFDMTSGDGSSRSVDDTFTVTVTDSNDNYPQINPSSYALTLNENVVFGASVVQITATDDDEGNAGTAGLQYSITNGNTGNVFTMTGSSLHTAGPVDADTQSIYILTVSVQDQGAPTLQSQTIVTIQIVAINEHAPTFANSTGSVTISEAEPVGNDIYTIGAADTDTGQFGVLRYYIRNGNVDNAFTIDLFNGVVRVANALDFDNAPNTYQLQIEVEDTATSNANTQTATATLSVTLTDANDETPVFTSNIYSVNYNENGGVSDSVVTVTANDADSGANGDITYTIIGGTGATKFSVQSSSGLVTTNSNVDYEELISYDLVVRAADAGTPTSLSSTCIVRITVNDLNDNTPTFMAANVAISIAEDTAVGTTIVTPLATDDDSPSNNNNVITYSLQPASVKFEIQTPATGAITVSNDLDREVVDRYVLVIHAVDGGTPANTGSLTYTVYLTDVNDNPPAIQNRPYVTTILEDKPANTIVFNVTATDPDLNENGLLSYTFTGGNTDNDFVIEPVVGLIQVRNPLDRERTNIYQLEVQVKDSGTPAQSSTVTCTVTIGDVNDNLPIFQPAPLTSYTFNVSENVPVGTVVNSVSATDLDTGVNGAVTYSFAYFLQGSSDHFTIDGSSGTISTAAALDREQLSAYILVVRATDGGTNSLWASATVTIIIDDFNDNIPEFSQTLYTGYVLENAAAGTSILTLVIEDDDININEIITLTIADTNANLYIGANSTSYVLYVKTPIDREAISFFNFTVTATDGGTPPNSFTARVQITVGDVNDETPVFNPTFYNNEIAYNDGCQVTVAMLTATDADSGINSDLAYSTTQNNNPHLFSLNSQTGQVSLIATAGVGQNYRIYAAATDSGTPSLTSSPGATVRVDTYDPEATVINFYLGIGQAAYLAAETTFLTQLTNVFQNTYPTSQAKRWCTAVTNISASVVRVYVLENDNADDISELNIDKRFLSMQNAYAIVAKDSSGTPADIIKGSGWTQFSIYRVEKYKADVTTDDTPWIQTATGIAVVTVICVLVFIFIVAAIVYTIYRVRNPVTGKSRSRVEAHDNEGDHVARDQYHSQAHRTVDTIKPYNKNHPPPAVVSLPMPTATKKVPMQLSRHHHERQGPEVNLFDDMKMGPTLVKRPEKLRPESPVQADQGGTHGPPRKLPPLYTSDRPPPYRPTPPSQRPPRLEGSPQQSPASSVNQEFPEESTNYLVLNREFDGRAIDPATGRLYEYNTRTNERRWVQTPDGKDVRLRREED